jgi:hypothetical protein
MNRLYRYSLAVALSAAALSAQDKPTIDRDRMQRDMERAQRDMERAHEKMSEMRLNLNLDLEPMLLAQKIATETTEKINEKVNEKLRSHFVLITGATSIAAAWPRSMSATTTGRSGISTSITKARRK